MAQSVAPQRSGSAPGADRSLPWRKPLWKAGMAWAIFIATLAVGNAFIARQRAVTANMLGHDFMPFYMAGTYVRQGRLGDLYDLPASKSYQQELARREGLDTTGSFGPFWNPPFYALVFAPLAGMDFKAAQATWIGVNVVCLAVAIALLVRLLGDDATWSSRGLVVLLTLASMPCIMALTHGQNTCTSLLILVCTVHLWRARRALAAGVVCGLLFYKPQLGAIVALVLVLTSGWRALAGLAITGAAMLAVTLMWMPGTLGDYLHRLPANVHYMQIEQPYLWHRHVTLKAFWRLLVQGRASGEPALWTTALTWISAGGLGLALAYAIWRNARRLQVELDRCIAATIAAMPLLMPFYFDYDLLLMAVPATLLACEWMQRRTPLTGADRALRWAWVALFIATVLNAPLAPRMGVHLTVPVLVVIAGLLIRRVLRNDGMAAAREDVDKPREVALAA